MLALKDMHINERRHPGISGIRKLELEFLACNVAGAFTGAEILENYSLL